MNDAGKKYQKAFIEAFGVEEDQLEHLEYQSIAEWDSVGHMGLVAQLEEEFDIEIEMDDVIALESYAKGKLILVKYSVIIE